MNEQLFSKDAKDFLRLLAKYDVRLRSVPFERAWASRVQSHITVDGVRVPLLILGLQDLRRAKQEAGRPKDLDDLQHLPKA